MNRRIARASVWMLQIALATFFILAGAVKIAGTEQIRLEFRQWGYTDGFRMFIGILEALGGLGVLIPLFAGAAAVGLMAIMGGAVCTHLVNNQGIGTALPAAVLLLLLGGVVYARREPLRPLIHFFERRLRPGLEPIRVMFKGGRK